MANRNTTPLPIDLRGAYDLIGGMQAGANIRRLLEPPNLYSSNLPPNLGSRLAARKERQEGREFAASEAEKARQFQAGESEKGREFTREQTETGMEMEKEMLEFQAELARSSTVEDAIAKGKAKIQQLMAESGMTFDEAQGMVRESMELALQKSRAEAGTAESEAKVAEVQAETARQKEDAIIRDLEVGGDAKEAATRLTETQIERIDSLMRVEEEAMEAGTRLQDAQAQKVELEVRALKEQIRRMNAGLPQDLSPKEKAQIARMRSQDIDNIIDSYIQPMKAKQEERAALMKERDALPQRVAGKGGEAVVNPKVVEMDARIDAVTKEINDLMADLAKARRELPGFSDILAREETTSQGGSDVTDADRNALKRASEAAKKAAAEQVR